MQKVKDILTSNNNLFNALQTNYSTFYTSILEDKDPVLMQNLLIIQCGERVASPLLLKYTLDEISDILVVVYGDSWGRIKDALETQYNVDKQYNHTTVENVEKTYNAENNDTTANTIGVYGFDSTDATDSQKEDNSTDYTRDEERLESKTSVTTGNNGNIQGSIEKEVRLRKLKFYDIIIKDISDKISLDIY